MLRTLLSLAVLFLAPVALAEKAGGVSWTAPASWKAEGERPMRAATYKVPAAKGDAEDGECAVFFFGPGQGGGVEANLQRWYGQFEQPDKSPSEKAAKLKKESFGGLPVTTVDLSGAYLASMGPMSPTKTSKPGFRLLGAIVEGPEGGVFFKCTGPAKTMDSARGDFTKLLKSIKKG